MDATMQIQLETSIPIIYGVLTPQDYLSEGRESFFQSHFVTKGEEAARACLMTLENDALARNAPASASDAVSRAQTDA